MAMIGTPGTQPRTHDELSVMADLMATMRAIVADPEACEEILARHMATKDEALEAQHEAAAGETAAREATQGAARKAEDADRLMETAKARIEEANAAETEAKRRMEQARLLLDGDIARTLRDDTASREEIGRDRRSLDAAQKDLDARLAPLDERAEALEKAEAGVAEREAEAKATVEDYETRLANLRRLASGKQETT